MLAKEHNFSGGLKIGEAKSYFLTDAVTYQEIGLKGEKKYYVTGYITTGDVDRYNEVVTESAMKEMLEQLKSGNVKLDIEHDTFTGNADIPVGKIIEAKMDSKGIWVKCELNKAHGRFQEVWDSIKNQFLDAFSIAYQVKDAVEKEINGVTQVMLNSLELLNVAITGNPVNTEAKMDNSFMKSARAFMKSEGNKMSEEAKNEEPQAEAPKEEAKVEDVKEEPKAEEEAKAEEAKAEEPVEEKKEEEKPAEEPAKEEPAEESKEEVVAEPEGEPKEEAPAVDNQPLDQIKSLNDQIVELKSEIDKLNKKLDEPHLKAVQTEMPEAPKPEPQTPLSSII